MGKDDFATYTGVRISRLVINGDLLRVSGLTCVPLITLHGELRYTFVDAGIVGTRYQRP